MAAKLFARLSKTRDRARNEPSRAVLKADTMIVASAVAFGAGEFYSNDAGCRAVAGSVMLAHDLPNVAPTLFDQ